MITRKIGKGEIFRELTWLGIVLDFVKILDKDVVLLYFLQTSDPFFSVVISFARNVLIFDLEHADCTFKL